MKSLKFIELIHVALLGCILILTSGCGEHYTNASWLNLDKRLRQVEQRVKELEQQHDDMVTDINSLSAAATMATNLLVVMQAQLDQIEIDLANAIAIAATQADVDAAIFNVQNQIDNLVLSIGALQSSVVSVQNTAASIQVQVNQNTADIAAIQGYPSIVEFIDPCGDGPGFDEVLLKTATGQYVAYFESGGNRFLSLLSAGSYATTDASACHFTVHANGTVTW